MKISTLLLAIIPLSSALAQSDGFRPFSKLAVGGSVTYIWNPDAQSQGPGFGYTYHETTLNGNVATNIFPNFDLGLAGLRIFTSSSFSGKNDYFLAGTFGQYAIVNSSTGRLFLELGGFYGNYCTCGREDPYRRGGLKYLDLGIGYTPRIWKNLYLDLGFNLYEILDKVEDKYSYTQYVLGLEYQLR